MSKVKQMSESEIVRAVVDTIDECAEIQNKSDVIENSVQTAVMQLKTALESGDVEKLHDPSTVTRLKLMKKGSEEILEYVEELTEKTAFIGFLLNQASKSLLFFLKTQAGDQASSSFVDGALEEFYKIQEGLRDRISDTDAMIQMINDDSVLVDKLSFIR